MHGTYTLKQNGSELKTFTCYSLGRAFDFVCWTMDLPGEWIGYTETGYAWGEYTLEPA